MIHVEIDEVKVNIERTRSIFKNEEVKRAYLVGLAFVVESDSPLGAVVGSGSNNDTKHDQADD